MLVDMDYSRDMYRGRYRDRHNNTSTRRTNYEDRSTRSNNRKYPNSSHLTRNSPNSDYQYRSSRTTLGSRPVSSRNESITHSSHHYNEDYRSPSNESSHRTNYYDNYSSTSSRSDRPSNHHETHPIDERIFSNGSSSYYNSSPSIPNQHERSSSGPTSQYNESNHRRYESLSSYRRQSPSQLTSTSTYRNERSMDYPSRDINNDIYMRSEYRSPTPPKLALLSVRCDPYGDIYRPNDYVTRSERYDTPHRYNSPSRDYSTGSSNYRDNLYHSSPSTSMPPSSSYTPIHEPYSEDTAYRSTSQSRDYESMPLRTNYPSSMDYQDESIRNSRDRHHSEYYSSNYNRPNLKRSNSRYNDDGPTPPKRPAKR